jgi:hypothetical protein
MAYVICIPEPFCIPKRRSYCKSSCFDYVLMYLYLLGWIPLSYDCQQPHCMEAVWPYWLFLPRSWLETLNRYINGQVAHFGDALNILKPIRHPYCKYWVWKCMIGWIIDRIAYMPWKIHMNFHTTNAMKQKISEDFQLWPLVLSTTILVGFRSCNSTSRFLPSRCPLESQVDSGHWQHYEMASAYLRTSSRQLPLLIGMQIQRLKFP